MQTASTTSRSRIPGHLIERLEREGKLIILGGVYHLDTRKVEFLN